MEFPFALYKQEGEEGVIQVEQLGCGGFFFLLLFWFILTRSGIIYTKEVLNCTTEI